MSPPCGGSSCCHRLRVPSDPGASCCCRSRGEISLQLESQALRTAPLAVRPRAFVGPPSQGPKRSAVLTYRCTPCYAVRVTFFEGRAGHPPAGKTYPLVTEHNPPDERS